MQSYVFHIELIHEDDGRLAPRRTAGEPRYTTWGQPTETPPPIARMGAFGYNHPDFRVYLGKSDKSSDKGTGGHA